MLPHAPQWLTSVPTFTSQPLASWLSQFSQSVAQSIPHVLLLQVAVPWPPDGQTLLQLPQCAGLDAMSISHPFVALPSQSS